jgi:hypothetical protein
MQRSRTTLALTLVIGTSAMGCSEEPTVPAASDAATGTVIETSSGATDIPTPHDTGGADNGADTAPIQPPAWFGQACTGNEDCTDEGYCVKNVDGNTCTITCVEECPAGHGCLLVQNAAGSDALFLCVKEAPAACSECDGDGHCFSPGTRCIEIGGESRCADPCTDGVCPDGFDCEVFPRDRGAPSLLCVPVSGTCQCVGDDPGAAEICDGLDNDCDAEIDEDLEPEVCEVTNQLGVCQGWSACVDGGWACDAPEAEPEQCDGLDNDCDGSVDEDFADDDGDGLANCVDPDSDNDGLEGDADNCPADANPDQGDLDQDGVGDVCDPDVDGDGENNFGDCAPTNPDIHPGAEELCNGLDDDCDGQFDEGFADSDADGLANCVDPDSDNDGVPDDSDLCPNETDPSQTDLDGDGLGDACDDDKDGDGYTCTDTGSCDDCNDQDPFVNGDAEEICDDLDNDCNGVVDEGFVDTDGDKLADCVDDDDDGDGDLDVLDCAPEDGSVFAFAQELCDGLDNDCDGSTDEDLGGISCGKGACQHEVAACAEGQPGQCNPFEGAEPEVCDGIDNDCDGLVDTADAEDLLVHDQMACEWQNGVCGGTSKPLELCQDGVWVVCPLAIYATVAPDYEVGNELSCDGLDNDCDGLTDEDFTLLQATGDTVAGTGLLCGTGACAGGVTVCNAAGDGTVCATSGFATQELCNGEDDDCDGLVDAADDSMSVADVPPCKNQLGVCEGSIMPPALCVEGQWTACGDAEYAAHSQLYQASTETDCDGLDNDCDGQADEDFVLVLATGATVSGLDVDCGVGPCAGGHTQCAEDESGLECSTAGVAATELCNDDDDNCDGLVDNGAEAACISNVCSGGTCQDASCADGVQNGDESGEDCGGSCPKCPGGESCTVGTECESGTCDTGVCTEPEFDWVTGEFGDCSNACGDGMRIRSVTCVRSDGTTVDPGACNAVDEPSEKEVCVDVSQCAWVAGDFAACDNACGDGTATRPVDCRHPNGAVVPDDLCGALLKPDTTQACADTSGCTWVTGAFGGCSSACGDGTRARTVTCTDTGGQPVADTLCDGLDKPPETEVCTDTTACAWQAGTFGACDNTCGDGTQTRDVVCVAPDGAAVPDGFCSGSKPPTTQSCFDSSQCAWFAGGFGACNNVCGNGSRTRLVECRAPGGAAVPDSFCGGSKPVSSESCFNNSQCSWFTGSFGGCSKNCGSGSQSRTVQCRHPNGSQVPDNFCPGSKPATSQSCNTQACVVFRTGTGSGPCWNTSCAGGFGSAAACPSGYAQTFFGTGCGNPLSCGGNTALCKFFQAEGYGCPSSFPFLGVTVRECTFQ